MSNFEKLKNKEVFVKDMPVQNFRKRIFKKVTSSGKFMCYDPKTKRTQVWNIMSPE